MVANSVNAMVIVSMGDTNPHFGDFHFQKLTIIFNYQFTVHCPMTCRKALTWTDKIDKRVGAAKAALPAYLRVNGNRKRDFRDCGKPNPLNPPYQGGKGG